MGFTTLDYVIVVLYLVGMAVFGVVSGGRQKTTRDYFLGSKNIPWWAVCFAIVATETSTLTFISIPGLAYVSNLNFLQVTFGYLIGRIVISLVLLPAYSRGELSTAYEFLGQRFGTTMQTVASVTFMGTRLLADGVRLFATAIPLALLMKGWQSFTAIPDHQIYVISIIVMAGFTLTYTYLGGVKAVIWTDVVQMFIYIAGAVGAMVVILNAIDGGFSSLPQGKLAIFGTGSFASFSDFIAAPYSLAASLIGGAFLSMASHGTDQIIVQRLLTVRTLKESQKALVGSGIIVIVQFTLFLVIGVLLFLFYGGASLVDLSLAKPDELFPKFILERLPTGLSGLIIAGLLAAAMSTLSGSVNSLASATINDIYKPHFGRSSSDGHALFLSRIVSLVWCILLVGVSIFFVTSTSKTLVELALSIASVTYGGLLGAFLLGVLFRSVNQRDAVIAFGAGLLAMGLIFVFARVGWTWYTFIGTAVTLITGNVSAFLFRKNSSPS